MLTADVILSLHAKHVCKTADFENVRGCRLRICTARIKRLYVFLAVIRSTFSSCKFPWTRLCRSASWHTTNVEDVWWIQKPLGQANQSARRCACIQGKPLVGISTVALALFNIHLNFRRLKRDYLLISYCISLLALEDAWVEDHIRAVAPPSVGLSASHHLLI